MKDQHGKVFAARERFSPSWAIKTDIKLINTGSTGGRSRSQGYHSKKFGKVNCEGAAGCGWGAWRSPFLLVSKSEERWLEARKPQEPVGFAAFKGLLLLTL